MYTKSSKRGITEATPPSIIYDHRRDHFFLAGLLQAYQPYQSAQAHQSRFEPILQGKNQNTSGKNYPTTTTIKGGF